MEEGRFELRPRPFNMAATIQSTIIACHSAASEKNITISTQMEPRIKELGNRFIGDDIRLRQVMNNLLSNSMKCEFSSNSFIILLLFLMI